MHALRSPDMAHEFLGIRSKALKLILQFAHSYPHIICSMAVLISRQANMSAGVHQLVGLVERRNDCARDLRPGTDLPLDGTRDRRRDRVQLFEHAVYRFGCVHYVLGGSLNATDLIANPIGGATGLPSEALDLACHHRKTVPRLTCT